MDRKEELGVGNTVLDEKEELAELLERPVHVENVYETGKNASAAYILECVYNHETGERVLVTNTDVAHADAYAQHHAVSSTVEGNLHHFRRVLAAVEHFLTTGADTTTAGR